MEMETISTHSLMQGEGTGGETTFYFFGPKKQKHGFQTAIIVSRVLSMLREGLQATVCACGACDPASRSLPDDASLDEEDLKFRADMHRLVGASRASNAMSLSELSASLLAIRRPMRYTRSRPLLVTEKGPKRLKIS